MLIIIICTNWSVKNCPKCLTGTKYKSTFNGNRWALCAQSPSSAWVNPHCSLVWSLCNSLRDPAHADSSFVKTKGVKENQQVHSQPGELRSNHSEKCISDLKTGTKTYSQPLTTMPGGWMSAPTLSLRVQSQPSTHCSLKHQQIMTGPSHSRRLWDSVNKMSAASSEK